VVRLSLVLEDYHQCLKTGCAIKRGSATALSSEKRQLQEGERLLRLLGFLAPIAARLLQLREIARLTPKRLAIFLSVSTPMPKVMSSPTTKRLTVETDKTWPRCPRNWSSWWPSWPKCHPILYICPKHSRLCFGQDIDGRRFLAACSSLRRLSWPSQ